MMVKLFMLLFLLCAVSADYEQTIYNRVVSVPPNGVFSRHIVNIPNQNIVGLRLYFSDRSNDIEPVYVTFNRHRSPQNTYDGSCSRIRLRFSSTSVCQNIYAQTGPWHFAMYQYDDSPITGPFRIVAIIYGDQPTPPPPRAPPSPPVQPNPVHTYTDRFVEKLFPEPLGPAKPANPVRAGTSRTRCPGLRARTRRWDPD